MGTEDFSDLEDMGGQDGPGTVPEIDEDAYASGVSQQAQEQYLDDEREPRNLNLILDIPLQVRVELGRTKMLINDLLQLGQGSVIELSKLVGEPLEVLVNDKLVARGEVVVVNEKFGVRLTDIITPMERVEALGD
jgi:flagellar motor switch protein FliN/FliY